MHLCLQRLPGRPINDSDRKVISETNEMLGGKMKIEKNSKMSYFRRLFVTELLIDFRRLFITELMIIGNRG